MVRFGGGNGKEKVQPPVGLFERIWCCFREIKEIYFSEK